MSFIKSFCDWLPFGSVPGIDAQQLLLDLDKVQLVDVRTESEFATSHIAGSINLPITQFNRKNIEALKLNKQQPIVTICLSAHRSIPATRKLLAQGYSVRQLNAGMRAWWKAELPCETKQ